MNYLKGKRAYLSAPIESATDNAWRIEPSLILREEFGIDLFDPFLDPKQQWVAELARARDLEDYETVARISRNFVRKDLYRVDKSDLLIAYLPRGVSTTGTVEEIITANKEKTPVLLICPQGKKYIPFWYFSYIDHKQIFGCWNDLYEFLRDVNKEKLIKDFRWALIYNLL